MTGSKAQIEAVLSELEHLELPRGLESLSAPRSEAATILRNLARRLEEGAGAPLRLALFGPTGAGKSKIFNSLLREVVSPAGFRRPFTTRPVYSIHESHEVLASHMDGQTRIRRGDFWREIVLIDTPDFDSVEARNREAAERVFREAEAFLFVTDAQKYADQSTWQYLERIRAEGKPVIIVLNKVSTEGVARDFQSRLTARFGAAGLGADLISLDERPIDDAALLPPDDPVLARIRDRVLEVFGSSEERRASLVAAFRTDMERLLALWSASAERLQGYLEGIARLGARIQERFASAAAGLMTEIAPPIDQDVKAEVYARVLERIQQIDILRYPRRLLALPFEGIKLLAAKWWPGRGASRHRSPEEVSREKAFARLEARVLSLCDETLADFQAEGRCPELLSSGGAAALRLPHDELAAVFQAREREFRAWLDTEAKETASKLTSENKLKFILSQVIYNGVVVGVQIHTAGHFTLLEAAADGVLSPLVAKAVGMAVSSEKVGQFEKLARKEHARLLGDVLALARSKLEAHLNASAAWKGSFDGLARSMEALRSARDEFLRAYEGGSVPALGAGARKA